MGQFLRHDNHINEALASLFLEHVSQLHVAQDYASCFPYQAMLVEAPVEAFYEFYRV